jgi:hypothetical protein
MGLSAFPDSRAMTSSSWPGSPAARTRSSRTTAPALAALRLVLLVELAHRVDADADPNARTERLEELAVLAAVHDP